VPVNIAVSLILPWKTWSFGPCLSRIAGVRDNWLCLKNRWKSLKWT